MKISLRSVNIYLDKIVFPYLLHPVLQVINDLIAYGGGGRKNKELKILWFNSLLHKGDLEGSSSRKSLQGYQ